jgi:hypothetical protein
LSTFRRRGTSATAEVAGERALAEEKSLGRLQTICDTGSRAVSTYNRILNRWDTTLTGSPRQTCSGRMNPYTKQVEVCC